jgi:hypothetical protein
MRKLLVFVLLLLVSCQYAQVSRKVPQLPAIRTGTQGLELSFNPGSQTDIIMCKEVEVFLDITNKGAFDVENGKLSWIVEDQFLKPLFEKQQSFPPEGKLEGKNDFNPQGGVYRTSFKARSLTLPSQLEMYSSPLILQACYPYRTLASVPVCVDPDVRGVNKQKPCTPKTISLSGGQGAPVAVTRVETLMLPEGNKVRPMFKIFVQNLGSGVVVKEDDIDDACSVSRGLVSEDLQKFASFVAPKVDLQERVLNCEPVPVRIELGKESDFVCESDHLYEVGEGTFSTILNVELDYGYINTVVAPVTITRLPRQPACGK